jgi:hypothetical protein
MATMGQKSSLPQLTRSVSQVLMPDTPARGGYGNTTPEQDKPKHL